MGSEMCIRDSSKMTVSDNTPSDIAAVDLFSQRPINSVDSTFASLLAVSLSHPDSIPSKIQVIGDIRKIESINLIFNVCFSFFILTPASVAIYKMAVCMIKCEVRAFMQTDSL